MKTFVITTIILLTIALVFVVLPHYGIRTLPGRVEYLSPPEPEKVEYIAKPPSDLAELLFSTGVSERSREATWSNVRGKWVVWVGRVHRVEPQLKPSRMVFLDEYEIPRLSMDTGQFDIIVEFDPAWTERLRQLTRNETVYYRAKLVRREAGWPGQNGLIILENGQIIDSDDVAAKLVDLAYSSYQQLEKLIKEAENIATVSNYFEQRLERLGGKWILIRAILSPLNIKIPDGPIPSQTILVDKREHGNALRAKIEANLEDALASLHTAAPAQENYLRQYIQEALETNRKLVSEIERDAEPLKELGQKARQRSVAGLGDLLEAGIRKVFPIIEPVFIAEQALNEYLERKPVEQAIIASYTLLQKIHGHMEQVSANVVRACQLAYGR